ncbi:MAG: NUDIX domain-containing protein [Nevskiales bacterium]
MKPPKFCPDCAASLAATERDGAMRLVCVCGYVHWNNPTPVVAAIVERDGCVLLARNKTWPGEWFGLITGFLEANEHPEQGVLREVQEELGLSGEIVGFVGHYVFDRMNQIILAYHVRAAGEVTLGDELAAYKAVPIDQLRPWPFATGEAVRDWLARRKTTAGLLRT